MSDWNPNLYLKFENERNRPAQDLLFRIQNHNANHITDLGCGTGNSTAILKQHWNNATITGVDSSPNMLNKAKENLPDCIFILKDFHHWQADIAQDIIFANASLQWSNTPNTLFKNLINNLSDNGILAVQMPNNLNEPSHFLMNEIANRDRWKNIIQKDNTRPTMLSVNEYYDLLTSCRCEVSIWQTTYYHILASVEDIATMFSSTALKPYLDCLDSEQQNQFKQEYIDELKNYYPIQNNGKVLLALPRLFFIAQKS